MYFISLCEIKYKGLTSRVIGKEPMKDEKVKIEVLDRSGAEHDLSVEMGTNLREALIQNGLSPYEGAFKGLNCKGMGICGTCKIVVSESFEDWERRSCQIQCFHDLKIRLK